jgi:hypothetical protein
MGVHVGGDQTVPRWAGSFPFFGRISMTRLLSWASVWAVLWSIVSLMPAGAGAQPAGPKTGKVPEALANVGEYGEDLYDLVKATKWTEAAEKFKALKDAAKALPADLKETKSDKERRDGTLAALGKAVAAKDKLAAMRAANQVTLIAADLSEPFNPQLPAAVTRLDFYGRELEIGAAAKDLKQLKAAAAGLRKNWDKVRPAVKTGGGEAAVKKFDALITRVEAAKSVEDYGKLAKPILDEVDNLEKVFKK